MSTVDSHIGARVRATRFRAGMTLGSLATNIGVSVSRLLRFENGEERIPAQTIVRLCRILNVRPCHLFEPRLSGNDPPSRGARHPGADAPATAKAGAHEDRARAEEWAMRQARLVALHANIVEKFEGFGRIDKT